LLAGNQHFILCVFGNSGAGKPDIDLGINTFVTRKFRSNIGWQHSSIQAAYLGLANEASNPPCWCIGKHQIHHFYGTECAINPALSREGLD